jgi:VWFA-related protein
MSPSAAGILRILAAIRVDAPPANSYHNFLRSSGSFRMKQFLAAAVVVAFTAIPLAAQNSGKPAAADGTKQASSPEQIHVVSNLKNVLFSVTDKKHHLVIDLTKNDFRVFEDEKLQKIQFFSRESNLPLRIGILIDTSNSIRERLHFEQEAAIDFLQETLRPDKDQAFIVGFDVEPQLVQDYTDNLDKLATAIRSLQAGGGTGLYDAIYYACKQKMIYSPPPEPYLRRVMIVVSDGEDNQSVHTREEALAMAERGEVTIYAISTNRTGMPIPGDKVLKYLAEETGGRAFFPFEAADLAKNFQEISSELRSQYSLAYVPTDQVRDGTFRKIKIETVEKGLRVRAPMGYFAPSK